MSYSRVSYTGTGSILNATFPFSYLNQADIFVYVDGVSVPFTFLNGSTVIPNVNPVAGSFVQVRRITQKNTPPVNFTDGSVLLEKDLDLLATYGLYVAQESDDGVQSALILNLQNQLDARSLRIVNLAPGTAPTDAVNKAQNDVMISASAGSASAASASAGAASTSASQAAASAIAAQTSGSAVALQNSLASPTGAGQIGGVNQVVSSIAALRGLLKTSASKNAFATGYYAAGDGGGGTYWYDATDTTTADNGGTVIVATDSGRWKLASSVHISVKQFGAKGDGTTNDHPAIQAAINSGIRRIYFPSGRYSCLSTLNLCNLATTGVPLKLFGDATSYDNGTLTAGSVILSNPGITQWVGEVIGSQFVTIEDLMIVSTGANTAKGGLVYARSTVAGFAQNNSLRRVIIKIATGGGTVALANNCAEQFVCDECWLEADIPYITTLANEQGWTAANATIANTVWSNTAQSFRLTTFTPLTSTSMILTGLGTANFDNCVWIPKAGNVYAYGVTLRSSLQAYQDCQNITFTGQIESWVNAVRLEGNTRDVKFDFSTSNVTGAHILAVAATVHYSPKISTNPFNTAGVNVLAASGATVTVYGGNITIAPNLKLADANLKLLGTDVDGGNGNMNSATFFAVNSASSYHARWANSKTYGSTAWTPGAVVNGASVATVFAAAGVAFGDRVDVFWPYTNLGCVANASIESAGNVRITIINLSGFNQTFAAGTWKVSIERPTI